METACRKRLFPLLMPPRGSPCWRPRSPRANAALAARDLLIDTLRGQIARVQRMQFGASSEKLGREIEQLELAPEELETERDAPEPEAADPGIAARPASVRSLPGHLPR
ncbi:transposase [uncultured Agrobacterium sp.]|uniref:transposase n=1 Tax=uncultured Agrobacterium sp. TaxID=157277 RepID=UPI00342FED4A